MSNEAEYPRRLIEVDLPIRRISSYARPEKTTVHGNISTLHIWWARRPHAACRAVACAALWFDPADRNCPLEFKLEARSLMSKWAQNNLRLCSEETSLRFLSIKNDPDLLEDDLNLRRSLLDFLADYSQWDKQASAAFLECSRALTKSAHRALGRSEGTRPLVFDPFAGGGTIPLECLRVGAEAFASDLNPLAVLLNKVVLEAIPSCGAVLGERVALLGDKVRQQVAKTLEPHYPIDPDGGIPLVYLWARTVRCEGPGCGYSIPLIRSMDLGRGQHLALEADDGTRTFRVLVKGKSASAPTVKGGSVSCPCAGCGYTTPAKAVRAQLASRAGGSKDAQLLAVLVERASGRQFRSSEAWDIDAAIGVDVLNQADIPTAVINEVRPHKNTRGLSAVTRVGIARFQDLYTKRQLRSIEAFANELLSMMQECGDDEVDRAALTVLGLCFGRLLHQNSSCSRWLNKRNTIAGSFGKQALQVTWDFTEIVPTVGAPGSWSGAIEWAQKVIELNRVVIEGGTAVRAAAQECPLPSDSAALLFTDPPYFAAIPYADLSNFFYVWERKFFSKLYPDLFSSEMIDQSREVIVTDANPGPDGAKKDNEFFRSQMALALTRAREIVSPDGLGIVVFADARTESWEALLGALIESGWTVTASWPIDTEHQNRTQAHGAASLQSSIHLVCRPRENPDGSLQKDSVGDWRAVLHELPIRIHEWMPRLASEGVVGADAIFACLGPALEVFSRYSHVEKASGERVALRDYLEQVWAAVAQEALSMIFSDADTSGLEEDARLTAMWLWTLSTSDNGSASHGTSAGVAGEGSSEDDEDDGEEEPKKAKSSAGYALEYDAARKIAQGLGAHLEDLNRVVEIKGDQARLLSVAERTAHLFGKEQTPGAPLRRAKNAKQLSLFEELEAAEKDAGWGDIGLPPLGATTLDRVHQTMVLFAAGRGEALKRFLVEEGAGRVTTFWKLAQSLSALYPTGTDEKRWVDGVLARKKGLGF